MNIKYITNESGIMEAKFLEHVSSGTVALETMSNTDIYQILLQANSSGNPTPENSIERPRADHLEKAYWRLLTLRDKSEMEILLPAGVSDSTEQVSPDEAYEVLFPTSPPVVPSWESDGDEPLLPLMDS